VKNHRVHKVNWIAHYIALNHLPVFIAKPPSISLGVLMMMMIEHFVHGLIVMLLCPASFIDNNRFFFPCRHHLLLCVVATANTAVVVLGVRASADLSLTQRRRRLLLHLIARLHSS
jgi:hypothetical protein